MSREPRELRNEADQTDADTSNGHGLETNLFHYRMQRGVFFSDGCLTLSSRAFGENRTRSEHLIVDGVLLLKLEEPKFAVFFGCPG